MKLRLILKTGRAEQTAEKAIELDRKVS